MMGDRLSGQEQLFYEFSLKGFVPEDHLLRSVDRSIDLAGVRTKLRPFYSSMGRPSVCPELMIRMLLVGYLLGMGEFMSSISYKRHRFSPEVIAHAVWLYHN